MLSQSTHRMHDRKWDMRRKRILLIICFPIIFMMYLVVFTTFYLTQASSFCSWFASSKCMIYQQVLVIVIRSLTAFLSFLPIRFHSLICATLQVQLR